MAETATVKENKELSNQPTFGIVMPISEIDGLPPSHWSEVLQLLVGSAENAGFTSKLVSESNFSGVIQQRIIQNLYQNELVVCDVSGQNPNVMFELGLRLAFDKATIVVVDDKTKISFDTSPIEHLIYPRDLRHGKMVDFTARLTEMIIATHKESQKEGYSTFLRHFGTFDVKGLKAKEIGVDEFVVSAIQEMRGQLKAIRHGQERNITSVQEQTDRTFFEKLRETNRLTDLIFEAIGALEIQITKDLDVNDSSKKIRNYIAQHHGLNISRDTIIQKIIDFVRMAEFKNKEI